MNQWAGVDDAPSADKPTAIGAVLLKDTRPIPPGLKLWRTSLLVRFVVLPLGPQPKPYMQCSSIGTDYLLFRTRTETWPCRQGPSPEHRASRHRLQVIGK